MSFATSFTKNSSRHDAKAKNSPKSGRIEDGEYVENVSVGNYIIIKELGSGSTAKVVLAFDKDTKKKVAIKIVERRNKSDSILKNKYGTDINGNKGEDKRECDNKEEEKKDKYNKNKCNDRKEKKKECDSKKEEQQSSGFSDTRIYREIVISSLLDHPHIVKLLDFLYSKSHFFLIFEYVKGRQLYDVILKTVRIPEDKARKYFRQLLSAIDYIHGNSIAHRDMKIENIIVDHNDNVKILDFGLSNFYDNKRYLQTFCGSLYFAAPELLMGRAYSGPEVDVWSLGIILYVMLCGVVPFDDESVKDLQNKIKEANFEINVPISAQASDLLRKVLVSDVSQRFTISEILKSAWVNTRYKLPVENYMGNRFQISELNSECVKALSHTLLFQFPALKEDLENYLNSCKKSSENPINNSMSHSLPWNISPAVSLYYLLLENISSYSKIKSRELIFDIKDLPKKSMDSKSGEKAYCNYPEILHKFVCFVFSNVGNSRPSKFFKREVFDHNKSEVTNRNTHDIEEIGNSSISNNAENIPNSIDLSITSHNLNIEPAIKTSYIKGLFQGIRIKHIGSKAAIKRILVDIFKKNSVSFESDENGYYCSYSSHEEECYFKVSLYYNVILSDYCLILKCLNNKKDSFKAVYDTIENSLKYTA